MEDMEPSLSGSILDAIAEGREEEVEARLRRGEDVNSVMLFNRPALHCAVANEMTGIVEMLLRHKSDVTVSANNYFVLKY